MSGAESNNGTTEAEINLKITLKVQQLLEQSGCTVILTRSDENGIYSLDAKTLREKNLFLEFHYDGLQECIYFLEKIAEGEKENV